jgi:hypothetical protein
MRRSDSQSKDDTLVFTRYAAAFPQKHRAPAGRRLLVVDIENVACGAVRTTAIANWAHDVVAYSLQIEATEQVVVGTSHIGMFHVWSSWPGARLRVRSGENGADLELLDVIEREGIERRFDELAVVSGDGIFTDAVARLGARGVKVTVAAWPQNLSKRLRLAAENIVYLTDGVDSATRAIA